MKQLVIRDWADPPVFELVAAACPHPGAGEVAIAVHTIGVNFGDTVINAGRYQVRPHLPFTPGTECSGTIADLGTGVSGLTVGQPVAVNGFIGDPRSGQRIIGACAERIIVPAAKVMVMPAQVPLEQAALFRSNAETSLYALQRGQLAAGETLLVLGASGGTGFAAVQIGKIMGARVIASASSAEKRAIALAGGADVAIDSTADDWRDQVRELTGGRGLDVVYDPVGGDATERAVRALASGGRLLVIGFAAGRIPAIATNLMLMKNAAVVGANLLAGEAFEPDRTSANGRQLVAWLAEGRLSTPPVGARYPLERAGEAFAAVASGQIAGRVVISVASH